MLGGNLGSLLYGDVYVMLLFFQRYYRSNTSDKDVCDNLHCNRFHTPQYNAVQHKNPVSNGIFLCHCEMKIICRIHPHWCHVRRAISYELLHKKTCL